MDALEEGALLADGLAVMSGEAVLQAADLPFNFLRLQEHLSKVFCLANECTRFCRLLLGQHHKPDANGDQDSHPRDIPTLHEEGLPLSCRCEA